MEGSDNDIKIYNGPQFDSEALAFMSLQDREPGYLDDAPVHNYVSVRLSSLDVEQKPRGHLGNEIRFVIRLNRVATVMLYELKESQGNFHFEFKTHLGSMSKLASQTYQFEQSTA